MSPERQLEIPEGKDNNMIKPKIRAQEHINTFKKTPKFLEITYIIFKINKSSQVEKEKLLMTSESVDNMFCSNLPIISLSI